MDGYPTHRHKPTGSIVFPSEGYDPKDLEPIEEGYWANQLRAMKVAELKSEAAKRILDRYPDWKQRNAALEPDEPWVQEMRVFIKEVRDWSNREEEKLHV